MFLIKKKRRVCSTTPGKPDEACSPRSGCKITNFMCNNKTLLCIVCPPGYYGDNCSGSCAPGSYWKGGCCAKCKCPNCDFHTGKYLLPNLNETCTPKCGCKDHYLTCNETSLKCEVCPDGYHGNNCYQTCPDGHYGKNCSGTCKNCLSGYCNPVTGDCKKCKSNFYGKKCQRLCLLKNKNSCNINCICPYQYKCNSTTLKCEKCPAGYYGQKCEYTCPEGTFGESCLKKCNCIKNRDCSPITGKCCKNIGGFLNKTTLRCEVCPRGYFGKNCKIICPPGTYGENCGAKCYCKNVSSCNHITGCEGECKEGYTGLKCNSCSPGYVTSILGDSKCLACSPKSFGKNCAEKCNCNVDYCDKVYGCICSTVMKLDFVNNTNDKITLPWKTIKNNIDIDYQPEYKNFIVKRGGMFTFQINIHIKNNNLFSVVDVLSELCLNLPNFERCNYKSFGKYETN